VKTPSARAGPARCRSASPPEDARDWFAFAYGFPCASAALLLLCDAEQTFKDVERMHQEDMGSRSSAMPELLREDEEL
jgi:hypothetical protein